MAENEYPGVYVEEISSGVRAIEGVPTSIAVFIGRAWRGPIDQPVLITSFREFERQFGGLWRKSTVSFAVRQFFENDGTRAFVVRVATRSGASAAKSALIKLKGGEVFRAANVGTWGLNLKITIDHAALTTPKDERRFNLTVTDDAASRRDSAKRGGSGATERFVGVSVEPADPQFVGTVLEQQSQLLRMQSGLRATASPRDQANVAATCGSASDGATIGTREVTATANRAQTTGLYALDKVDLFNLLCIPPYGRGKDNDIVKDWAPAAQYCGERGAFLLVDAPASWTAASAVKNVSAFSAIAGENVALYFPQVLAPNPFDGGKPAAYPPCGMIAGIMNRVDTELGVWKAPANEVLRGVTGLSINRRPGELSDSQREKLNAAGINCLRNFPGRGIRVWGARTLAAGGAAPSVWKYIPVRRLLLYLEQSIHRGTRWVIFEGNEPKTWSAVTRQVESFLHNEWQSGALQGDRPSAAFFVKCDRSTMTEDDILNGRLIAIVGVAPVRPAEFVIFRLSQKTVESAC